MTEKKEKILMEKMWLDKLKEEFKKPYMHSLQEFLQNEYCLKKTIFPPKRLIFNAFCQTPYDKVKVVIMGQDPYHGPNQAHGLSFSVPKQVPPPPSLMNIYKELQDDEGITMPKTGYLLPWAKQGVLLLNATLTVELSRPQSHYAQGWELFTDKILEILWKKEDPIVFLLWGRAAQEKCKQILIGQRPHLILKAPHPSPLSAYNGFFGCKHFSKTNAFLKKNEKKEINWQLP